MFFKTFKHINSYQKYILIHNLQDGHHRLPEENFTD